MRCLKCDSDNRDGRKFCANCGAPLVVICPKCSSANRAGERFCGECGGALSAGEGVEANPDVLSSAGERRHLTVLFCDLAGSTRLAAQLDPEEWRETVAGYQRAAAEAVTRFGGAVMRYVGDGIMAFFGYPVAYENDAERAARAGLAILDAITELNDQPAHVRLSVRIGIDSGRMVVGAGAGKEVDAFGDAANIAARVQAAAEPGTVVVTGEIHRLISGLFEVEDRGAQTLKGIAREVQLYRVIRPTGVRGRFEAAAAAGGLTPFVGREDELRTLQSQWGRALDGEGQVALIIGEAGIGKSRLLQRFREQIAETPHTWIEAGAGAFFQNTPFYPVSELLHQVLSDAPGQAALVQLAPRLAAAGLNPAEAIPLLAPLLNLPLLPEYPSSTLSPEQQRRRLLATLVEWVLGSARAQPLVIATEDLHWIDPSTLELIELLVEQGATARLLLLYTARPEFRPPWSMRAHHTQITLNRLSASDVREIVREVAAQKALSDETVAAVVERTGGVPLFVEELTRAVLESGDAELRGRAIPVTLHDSLMARLDRLGPAKEVIQVGAVIGSDFSYELLHAVHPLAEADLQRMLRNLTGAELLYVRGIAPEATYQFKHALIRDVAYEALLKRRRKELHSEVADVLMRQFPDMVTSAPELVAHHYTEAGLNEQAVPHWERAGRRATERSANKEAASHFTRGLELLKAVPDSPERIRRELTLQIALGATLIAVRGYASPEVGLSFNRARELCEQIGTTPQLSNVLQGLWSFYNLQADYKTSLKFAEQSLNLAESERDPAKLLQAHFAVGGVLFLRGQLASARTHYRQGLALYKFEEHRSLAFTSGSDVGILTSSCDAKTAWYQGYPDQALTISEGAVALAEKESHAFTLAFALDYAAWCHQLRREAHKAQQLAERTTALCTEHSIPLFLARGTFFRGWALAEDGKLDEGIAEMRDGMAAFQATGAKMYMPFYLALIAQASAKIGEPEQGLVLLARALATVERTEERHWEAELYRLKGELTLQSKVQGANSPMKSEVDECFRKAIDIARKQGAKSLELRATTSLARVLASRDCRDEAHTMLAEIYSWFTEGFDTADLKDAKVLLDELAT
jgi:class 3 adenylate cyclase/predicted ATPase